MVLRRAEDSRLSSDGAQGSSPSLNVFKVQSAVLVSETAASSFLGLCSAYLSLRPQSISRNLGLK